MKCVYDYENNKNESAIAPEVKTANLTSKSNPQKAMQSTLKRRIQNSNFGNRVGMIIKN